MISTATETWGHWTSHTASVNGTTVLVNCLSFSIKLNIYVLCDPQFYF